MFVLCVFGEVDWSFWVFLFGGDNRFVLFFLIFGKIKEGEE